MPCRTSGRCSTSRAPATGRSATSRCSSCASVERLHRAVQRERVAFGAGGGRGRRPGATPDPVAGHERRAAHGEAEAGQGIGALGASLRDRAESAARDRCAAPVGGGRATVGPIRRELCPDVARALRPSFPRTPKPGPRRAVRERDVVRTLLHRFGHAAARRRSGCGAGRCASSRCCSTANARSSRAASSSSTCSSHPGPVRLLPADPMTALVRFLARPLFRRT